MDTLKELVHDYAFPLAALLFATIVICANMLAFERVECPQCGDADTSTVDEWGSEEGRRCNKCNFGWTRTL